jgi:hypothetical protein
MNRNIPAAAGAAACAVALAAALITVPGGCAGIAGEKDQAVPGYEKKPEAYEVADHKTRALGEDVPEWVSRYISGGLSEVEAMAPYKAKYVFIGEESGNNLNALRQWAAGFSVDQDFSYLVSSRIQARFAGADEGSPEEAYGRYFEDVVKSTSDASYTGARRESDFWLLRRYFGEDGKTVDREVYECYVLVSIDKSLLEKQIQGILEGMHTESRLSKNQVSAVEQVRDDFFGGF